MTFTTMDVTLGEMAALCDYSNDIACRANVDFLSSTNLSCLLCGSIDRTEHGTHAAAHHLNCTLHKKRAQQYYTCFKSLLALERRNLASQASPRELVLTYLGERLAQANVIRGVGAYNNTAVAFLLKRTTAPELLRVFGEITASQASPTRGVCSICMERPSTVMFQDCKHVCVCTGCASRLVVRAEDSEAQPMCPICRKCRETVPVYIS